MGNPVAMILQEGYRTQHPDAQWFPEAKMGLMIPFGIHSVAGVQPSWAMLKNCPFGSELHPPERYYALAEQFNPTQYDPDRWMEAASKAGFTYAVLIAKHHDGYTLWPSEYGDMGTHRFLNGKDLVQPYVDACRGHGIKVGLYLSFSDWHHPLYLTLPDFDFSRREERRQMAIDKNKEKADFREFFEFTRGQVHELLTRYGKIDLFWFDGCAWRDPTDPQQLMAESGAEITAWMRDLQPAIVINNRWSGCGDYITPECRFPKEQPDSWWELCQTTNGHWGYNKNKPLPYASWFTNLRKRCNRWGGNFLPAIGPAPDGTMPHDYYDLCRGLADMREAEPEQPAQRDPE